MPDRALINTCRKLSLTAVLALTVGCASTTQIEEANSNAERALRAAEAAEQAAAEALRKAEAAMNAAQAAQRCCDENRSRIDRAFRQSQQK